MVKNLPSNAGDTGVTPVRELRSHIPKISHNSDLMGQQSLHGATREKRMYQNKDPEQPKKKKKLK